MFIKDTMTFFLSRTGDAPLSFKGERVATADSRAESGPGMKRWFVLTVYRTNSGYVGAINFVSTYAQDRQQNFSEVCGDAAALRAWFKAFDPCSEKLWSWLPSGVARADERNAHNKNVIRACYQDAVSRLLESEEFAEKAGET